MLTLCNNVYKQYEYIFYMTKDWIRREETSDDEKTLKDIMEEPASKYVRSYIRRCPVCFSAESIIRNKKKLSKILELDSTKIIIEAIKKNELKNFSSEDLISATHAKFLTDGNLQRNTLMILTSLGYIKKTVIAWTDKKGKTRKKFIYNLLVERKIPECYNQTKDEHEKSSEFWNTIEKEVMKY